MENLKELLNAVLLALFIQPSLYWAPAGLPFLRLGETFFYCNFPIKRFSGMQAGLLKNWQARLSKSNSIRKITAQWFIDALGLIKYCNNISYLRLPILALDHESREKILLFSKREGLGMSAMYPIPIHEIEELREQFKGVNFPIAKEVSRRILTIPTHQLLTQSDKKRIVALMNLHADELATLRGHELVLSVKKKFSG